MYYISRSAFPFFSCVLELMETRILKIRFVVKNKQVLKYAPIERTTNLNSLVRPFAGYIGRQWDISIATIKDYGHERGD